MDSGAVLFGVGSRDRLKDAPPSVEMDYLLPGAQSCIIWAYATPIETLEHYLAKNERASYKNNMYFSYSTAWRSAVNISEFIEKNSGFKAKPVPPNAGYRVGVFKFKTRLLAGRWFLKHGIAKKIVARFIAKTFGEKSIPGFSLRYGAVAAGIGRIGWSGNLMSEEYGSAIYLAGALTTAPMEADPIVEKNHCNKCKCCVKACPTGFFSMDEEEPAITIAGRQEIYAKRNLYARCYCGCGGLSGLGQDGKWSTWTPDHECLKEVPEESMASEKYRSNLLFKLLFAKDTPETQRQFNKNILIEYMNGGILGNIGLRSLEDTHPTCGACQSVCVADPGERKRLLGLLQSSGKMFVDKQGKEYIERADGSIYYPPVELDTE